ncbi:MAG: hypothetical protein ACLR8P_07850 [Clostridium fessum]
MALISRRQADRAASDAEFLGRSPGGTVLGPEDAPEEFREMHGRQESLQDETAAYDDWTDVPAEGKNLAQDSGQGVEKKNPADVFRGQIFHGGGAVEPEPVEYEEDLVEYEEEPVESGAGYICIRWFRIPVSGRIGARDGADSRDCRGRGQCERPAPETPVCTP